MVDGSGVELSKSSRTMLKSTIDISNLRRLSRRISFPFVALFMLRGPYEKEVKRNETALSETARSDLRGWLGMSLSDQAAQFRRFFRQLYSITESALMPR